MIAAGVGQVMLGVVAVAGGFTTRCTLAVVAEYFWVFEGVKVTDSVSVPAAGTVPAAGEYENFPGTFAAASSCVELSAVPKLMGAGVAQVIVGVDALLASLDSSEVPDAPAEVPQPLAISPALRRIRIAVPREKTLRTGTALHEAVFGPQKGIEGV